MGTHSRGPSRGPPAGMTSVCGNDNGREARRRRTMRRLWSACQDLEGGSSYDPKGSNRQDLEGGNSCDFEGGNSYDPAGGGIGDFTGDNSCDFKGVKSLEGVTPTHTTDPLVRPLLFQ